MSDLSPIQRQLARTLLISGVEGYALAGGAARKVLAIVDRLEARGYTDLRALAGTVGQQASI